MRSSLDSNQASAWALLSPQQACACWFCRRLDKSTYKVLVDKIWRQNLTTESDNRIWPQNCWQTPKYVPRWRKQTHHPTQHITDLRSTLDEPCWPKTPYTGSLTCLIVVFVLFCFDVFNFVLSRRLNLTLYLFDARHVDMRRTTGSLDMSYVACSCPGHVVDRRSWLQACSSSRLHTIGLQLCRHGRWVLACPYTKIHL
jgi:hypothetical protein